MIGTILNKEILIIDLSPKERALLILPICHQRREKYFHRYFHDLYVKFWLKPFLLKVKDENLGRGEKADYFTVKGTVTSVFHKNPVWYMACPNADCNKKVVEVSVGQYHCDKCQKTLSNYQPRYTIYILIC
jgi:hypothetical protein